MGTRTLNLYCTRDPQRLWNRFLRRHIVRSRFSISTTPTFPKEAWNRWPSGLSVVVLGFIFQGNLRRWYHLRPWKEGFIVVAGDGREARRLCEDLGRNSGKVRKSPGIIWAVSRAVENSGPKALVIQGDLNSRNFWRKRVGIKRAGGLPFWQARIRRTLG